MRSARSHSGDLSQDSPAAAAHRTPVMPEGAAPADRHGARFYSVLSSSSVGLELGISVVISLLFGIWLDGKLGTTPWLMLVFLIVGFIDGFRGVLRAVRRSDRAAERGA